MLKLFSFGSRLGLKLPFPVTIVPQTAFSDRNGCLVAGSEGKDVFSALLADVFVGKLGWAERVFVPFGGNPDHPPEGAGFADVVVWNLFTFNFGSLEGARSFKKLDLRTHKWQ